MQPEPHPNPTEQTRVTAGYALTLFILGTVVGLLALLGRLAHELHAALLNRIAALSRLAQTSAGELGPLLQEPGSPGAVLILTGFTISTLCLLASALLWRRTGHPTSIRERIWGRFAHAITVLLWLGMGAAALVPPPGIRIALLVASGGVALVGLIAFVFLLVEFRFLNSTPPLPDEQPPTTGAPPKH